jgi:hypothetical protein
MLLAGVFRLDGGKQFGIGLFDKYRSVEHDGSSEVFSDPASERAAQANG